MARIVQQAAAGNQTLNVSNSSKMRFRPRLPTTIKTPSVLVKFSINMPRQIRSRISYPRNAKIQRSSSADSSDGTNYEVVLSPTGRVAVGPWLGPFESCDATAEHVYFVDAEGIAHLSLASQAEEVQEVPKRSPTPSLTDVPVSSVRRAHMAEVRHAHSKFSTHKNWPGRRSARSAARMNKVHQPRPNY